MSDNLLLALRHRADLALKSHTVEEGMHHLSQGFSLFSVEAERLKNAIAKLQEQLDHVNRELSQKTQFLNNILQNISDAIVFIDLEGTIAMINEMGMHILGQKNIVSKKVWEIFPDDHFGFSMKEALRFGISHRLLYKSLGAKELEISTTFIYEGPKPYHGLMIVLRDISEKQQLQWLISRGNRMKELGEMAATVAHEIRNPLGGIRGYASLLQRDLQTQPHLQEMAHHIVEGTKVLERLVTTVLHYSRPIQIHPESHELGSYLKQLGKFVQIDPAFPRHVTLQMHIPAAPLLVPIDSAALKSALLNLIFNAFQAMPHGGQLALSLLKLDNAAQISVSDTGVGMDEEMQKKLFSPFFTTKQKGNGLGLVEAQKIVHAHGGAIDVRSAMRRGTTFTITLPIKR